MSDGKFHFFETHILKKNLKSDQKAEGEKGGGGYSYMNAGQLCWREFEEAMSQPEPVLCEQYMEASLWSC